jgi:hypothetical protein
LVGWLVGWLVGEKCNCKITFDMSLIEFPANETDPSVVPRTKQHRIYISQSDTPLNLTLLRPLLSTIESVAVVGFGAVSGLGIALAVYYRSRRLSLVRVFSKLSAEHSFLTRAGSSIIIVIMWFLFVRAMLYFTLTYPQQFSIAVYFVFTVLAVGLILLTVGLLEFILEGWGMLQTALGFIVALILSYILYLALHFWKLL